MSSTDSIHMNSLDSVNKFGVSTRIYSEITSFSRDDTCQWNRTSSDLVRLVSNSFKTRDNRQNTYIHVNTHENTYWWSGTNYEPVWHVPTGSEMVPCLLGRLVCPTSKQGDDWTRRVITTDKVTRLTFSCKSKDPPHWRLSLAQQGLTYIWWFSII